MKVLFRVAGAVSVVATLTLMIGCGSSDDEGEVTLTSPSEPTAISTQEPVEDVVITIGNHIDLTGPAANPMAAIDTALDDAVKYYNEAGLIPGVELKVVTYDNQYDPSRDIPGYEWLKSKGADVILASAPATAVNLKTRLAEDKMGLFGLAPDEAALDPPGYVFCSNAFSKHAAYTLLSWIAENDPDFPKNRPARIGGACWTDGFFEGLFDAAEEYAKAHPDQYDWVDGFLTNFSFTWNVEVEALKDCDYVIPPSMITNFAREYYTAEGAAKFIGVQNHLAFLGLVDDADLWEEIDEMIVLMNNRWWNEEGPIINMAKELLQKYHSIEEAQEIIHTGTGYLAFSSIFVMFEIIKDTVEVVGPQNFNSEAWY